MKTRAWADFQIRIGVPLKRILHENSLNSILHDFVCLLFGYISVKKVIENSNSAGAGLIK